MKHHNTFSFPQEDKEGLKEALARCSEDAREKLPKGTLVEIRIMEFRYSGSQDPFETEGAVAWIYPPTLDDGLPRDGFVYLVV